MFYRFSSVFQIFTVQFITNYFNLGLKVKIKFACILGTQFNLCCCVMEAFSVRILVLAGGFLPSSMVYQASVCCRDCMLCCPKLLH
jgi:hypothetical protein